jgi:endonuclease-3
MPRESISARAARVLRLIELLRQVYPNAKCELNFRTPLELLVATILSAQCSDKQVNRVTERLFERYRSAAAYANSPPEELEQEIRRLGLFRSKARNIRACCRRLADHHQGQVPATLSELTALEGVGRKTANVVLGNAFGRNEGLVVDTHVTRLAQRLGLTKETSPEHIERDLMKLVPTELWTLFSHWLIWHGRRRCAARRPDCQACELQKLCPSASIASAGS